MKPDEVILEVRDKDLNRLGVILPKDFDFEIADVHNNIGSWTVTVAAEHPLAEALRTPGAGIVLTAGGIMFSGPALQPEYAADKDDITGTVTVKGVSDKVILSDSLAYPQPGNADVTTQAVAGDERTGNAEALMYAYVDYNIGPNGATVRKHRKLTLGTSSNRGTSMTKRPRFQVLGDLLNEIAAIDGLGYQVVQRAGGLVFEVYPTNDRRLAVRLSVLNGELDGQAVATSAPGVTRAIVGGQGDLVARKFVEVSTTDSTDAEAMWGRRIERFIDERSTNLTADLTKAGQEVLAEQGFTYASMQAFPTEDSDLVFGIDYGLGDLVTVEVEGTEVTSFVSGYVLKAGVDGIKLGVVLGNPDDFAEDGGMARQLATVTRQVSALERAEPELQAKVTSLETRTGALETSVTQVSRWQATVSMLTAVPNDGAFRTVYQQDSVPIPSWATRVHVTFSYMSAASANAAGPHHLLLKNASGAWVTHAHFYSHNNGFAGTNMGTTFSLIFLASEVRQGSNTLSLALNAATDSGSGSWQSFGQANLSITFTSI